MKRSPRTALVLCALLTAWGCTRDPKPSHDLSPLPGAPPLERHAGPPVVDAGPPVVDAGSPTVDAGPPIEELGLKLGVALHEAWAQAKVGDVASYDLRSSATGTRVERTGTAAARVHLEVVGLSKGFVWVQATFGPSPGDPHFPPSLAGAWLIPVELSPKAEPAPLVEGEYKTSLVRAGGAMLGAFEVARDLRNVDGPATTETVALPVGATYLGGGMVRSTYASSGFGGAHVRSSISLVNAGPGKHFAFTIPDDPFLFGRPRTRPHGRELLGGPDPHLTVVTHRAQEGALETVYSEARLISAGTPAPPGSLHLGRDTFGPIKEMERNRRLLPEVLVDVLRSAITGEVEGSKPVSFSSPGLTESDAVQVIRHLDEGIQVIPPMKKKELARFREVFAVDPRSPSLGGMPFEGRLGPLESVQIWPAGEARVERWVGW